MLCMLGCLPPARPCPLQGELAPDALVVLDPTELASQQLSAWREKKAEEMTKAKFLDEGVWALQLGYVTLSPCHSRAL